MGREPGTPLLAGSLTPGDGARWCLNISVIPTLPQQSSPGESISVKPPPGLSAGKEKPVLRNSTYPQLPGAVGLHPQELHRESGSPRWVPTVGQSLPTFPPSPGTAGTTPAISSITGDSGPASPTASLLGVNI